MLWPLSIYSWSIYSWNSFLCLFPAAYRIKRGNSWVITWVIQKQHKYRCASPLTTGLLSCDVEGKACTSSFSSFTALVAVVALSGRRAPCTHTSMGSFTGCRPFEPDCALVEELTGARFWKNWIRVVPSFLRAFCVAAFLPTFITGVLGEIGGDSKFVWDSGCLETQDTAS